MLLYIYTRVESAGVLRSLSDGFLGRCHGFLCLCDFFGAVLFTLFLLLKSDVTILMNC